jgi:hypothetical protein
MGRLTAVGHEVLVCTDRVSLMPAPIPTQLRLALTPYVFTEQAARDAAAPATGTLA